VERCAGGTRDRAAACRVCFGLGWVQFRNILEKIHVALSLLFGKIYPTMN
jgi:hypothetical protein